MKTLIPNEDFKLLKEHLPKLLPIQKATKKMIIEFWNEMNNALDNLEFGFIDQHHPKIIEQRRRAFRQRLNAYKYALSSWTNPYYVGGYKL
jgi:hypothetical protein